MNQQTQIIIAGQTCVPEVPESVNGEAVLTHQVQSIMSEPSQFQAVSEPVIEINAGEIHTNNHQPQITGETIANYVNLSDLCNVSFINVSNDEGQEIVAETAKDELPTGNSFVCNQLIQQYGSSNSDLVELHELLTSWGLMDLFPFFQKQHLFVGVLKLMSPEMARNILKDTCVPLGAQVIFNYHWNNWLNNSSFTNDFAATVLTQSLDPCEGTSKQFTTTSITTSTEKPLDLNTILKSNQYGVSLITAYQQNKTMNENLRKLLVESVLQYCIEQKRELSVKDCSQLALQIVKVFPGEEATYYHLDRKSCAPIGKLYQKYRNWKSGLSRKAAGPSSGATEKSVENSPLYPVKTDEADHIRALKHEAATMNYDEKLVHWWGCAASRLNSLRQNSGNSKVFFDSWPQFKNPDGYRLIDCDFNFMFGANNVLLDTLEQFNELMIEDILPKHVKSFKTAEDQHVWKTLNDKNDLSKNSSAAMVFRLIQTVLPFARIKTKKPEGAKKRFYFCMESQDAFLSVCATETEYKEKYDAKVKREGAIPPFMTMIGSLEDCRYILVDFDNITYKFHSFAKALDICFKTYHVFNIQYPEKCGAIWDMLNREFYKLQYTATETKPSTYVLLNEIKAAKATRFGGNNA